MKRLVVALTAIVAFTGSALAADMAPRPYAKAPLPVPVTSWTGCYISGGGGYGLYRVNHSETISINAVPGPVNATAGGDGWLATVGAGCDYQFNNRWVVGILGDFTWSDIRGDGMARINGVGDAAVGQLTNDWNWAVGARIGYLVNPNFLTYVNAGYTQAHFKQHNFNTIFSPSVATGVALPAQTFDGLFVGTGVEYAFDWLPGLFIRTEGRAAWYNRKEFVPFCASAGTSCAAAGPFVAFNVDSRKPIVYTAKTELVYRFNWGR